MGVDYMISFLNLEFFLILSEELNFNIAAKKLHITQQTLSGHIRKLEIHFGTKLFKYGPPLEITPAGILLRSYAAELLEKKKRMENDMLTLRAAKSGTLRIGCTFARAQFQLPQIIKDFNNKYPFIQVKIFEGNTPDVEEMLMKRNVDLSIGFVPETGQNIISLPLYDDPFLIVIHPSVISKYFPDRKTTVFSLDDHKTLKEIIENCPFLSLPLRTTIGKISSAYLASNNISPKHTIELRDVGTMLAMYYEEVGFMFCPKTLVRLSTYPFSEKHIIHRIPHLSALKIAINIPEDHHLSEPMESFIEIVQTSLGVTPDVLDE